jgi:predicted nuclease with TOPRIM domain
MTSAERKVTTLDDDLKEKSDVASSVIEKQLERHKLNEANMALPAGEKDLARLNLKYSAKQSEVKKLRDSLYEINSKTAEELEVPEKKTSALETGAD